MLLPSRAHNVLQRRHSSFSSKHRIPSDEKSNFNFPEENLPAGFPTYLTSRLAWRGSDFHDEQLFIHHLTEQDKREIHAGLLIFKSYGLDGDLVSCDNFPLPRLRYTLNKLALELHNGRGFFLLRGMNPKDYSVEDGMVIFLAIQAYIAPQRARQDVEGNMIVHVLPENQSTDSQRSKHYRLSEAKIPFHTDSNADILAFQTRNAARHGGACVISSAYTVYNELASTRPDVIRTLSQTNWPFAHPYYHLRPIMFHHSSHLLMSFNDAALLGSDAHPRPSSIPSLTPAQTEALNLVHQIAEAHRLEFVTEAGDMHFVNNLAILHRRDAFTAGVGAQTDRNVKTEKRHLVRMHLRNQELRWDLPPALAMAHDRAFAGEEEGGGNCRWHIVPMPPAYFPVRMDCL